MPISKSDSNIYTLLSKHGFNFRTRVTAFKYGLEIEVEGNRLPYGVGSWRDYADGSLRPRPERNEYISPPTTLGGINKALRLLSDAFKRNNAESYPSIRTSVHVHCNVQHFTASALASLLATYLIFEDSLYSVCGIHRKGNTFCAPLLTSYKSIYDIVEFLAALHTRADKIPTTFADPNRKYSSLNFRPVIASDGGGGYGTVEFRSHEGTMDTEKIYIWVAILDSLMRYAYVNTPSDVFHDFSANSIEDFAKLVFGDYNKFITLSEPSIRDGLDLAHIVLCGCNWDSLPINETKLPTNPFDELMDNPAQGIPLVEGQIHPNRVVFPTRTIRNVGVGEIRRHVGEGIINEFGELPPAMYNYNPRPAQGE